MRRTWFLAALAATLVAPLAGCAGKIAAPPGLAGRWEGQAEIACSWCQQRELHVVLTIRDNGAVEGKVGDATLEGGHLYANPARPGRSVGPPTKYVVKAHLAGRIIAAEGITREQLTMPIDLVGSSLAGALHTEGSEYGGKEKARLAAGIPGLGRT